MVVGERLATDRSSSSRLPVAATPLVGREREVATALERLLRPDVRLLTFTGPGGTGKTRLALAVAAGLSNTFADGVHFVDLAPLRDPGLVHATIAHALGIRDAGDQPLLETLRLYLHSRELLLLLDNFEQVVAAAALVSELLASCPALKVAVTSREPLHLSWEHEWPVPPLSLPPTDAVDRDQLANWSAVTLFVERARASKPDFELTAENARVVGDICVRLDGLPLAIELAAARVKLLRLTAIHARLQQRLVLLTGGPRDTPARHHTLRSAIGWSYGLLDPDEQATFRRLAIFVGGFSIEAVEAVCGVERPLDEECNSLSPTFNRLQSLLDKSLIRVDASTTGEPRFRLLETIREFGLEQLSASGELDAVQERHAHYFFALAEEGGREMVERMQGAWLDRLETEHDNLRAVLQWSLNAPGGTEIGPRLATAIAPLWIIRGYFSSGRLWFERIQARQDGTVMPAPLQVEVLWATASLAWRQGDYDTAARLGDQGIALGETISGASQLAWCYAIRGIIACHQAQYAIAHTVLDRGLEVARLTGDERVYAFMLGFCSVLSCVEGAYSLARSLGEESLRILRQRGELWGIAMNLDTLGSVARQQGEYDRAKSLHEESIATSDTIGDKWGIAISLANLGHIARAVGDDRIASSRYTESLHIHRELGDRRGIALALGNLGIVAERAGDQVRARDYVAESLAAARVVGDKRGTAAALRQLARLDLARGDGPTAAAEYVESLRLSADLKDRRGITRALEGSAAVLCTMNRPELARVLCVLADGLLASLGARRSPVNQLSYDELQMRIQTALGSPGSIPIDPTPRDLDLDQVVTRALAVLESKQPLAPRSVAVFKLDASPLSRREREIAILVSRGLTNRAIAAELVIAERTAETHVSNILGKLGLETRSQIAAWAVAQHLTRS